MLELQVDAIVFTHLHARAYACPPLVSGDGSIREHRARLIATAAQAGRGRATAGHQKVSECLQLLSSIC
jgi:hypothetical protein